MRGIFVLVLVVFALLIPSVNATTYYVDATGGNDNYNGLYPDYQGGSDGPWKTWNKVRGRTYSAGDTIRFRRDEVWNDITYAWTMDDSGEPGNYITIEDYGMGNKPILDAEEEFNGKTWIEETGIGDNIWSTPFTAQVRRVRLDGQDSYTASSASGIDGNTYLWHWNTNDDKLFIHSTQNPNNEYTNIKVTHSSRGIIFRFNNCSYIKLNNFELHGGVFAIEFRNAVGSDESHITIENCDIWYFFCAIVADKDVGGSANNITVQNCNIDSKLNLISKVVREGERCVYDTIRLENECDDWLISNNYIANAGHSILSVKSVTGLPTQGCNNNIVEHNTFDGSESAYSRALEMLGISNKCVGNIFRYNIEKNCNVRDQLGGNNNDYYYNLIYNRAETQITDKSDISEGVYLDVTGDTICDGIKVYNNVFYDIFNEAISISACSNALIKNNIVMDAGQGGDQPNIAVYLKSSAGAGNVISDNEFYDTDTSTVINYKGSKCTPAYADANHPEFSNNINSDPKFINAPNKDFRPQPGSPCIDKGTYVGLTQDYEGNSVPQGSAPEIGAYEYAEAVCEPDTYYVDATGGNDNNDGKCTNTAWKTVGKVNSESSSFSAGDSIKFKRGEHWREMLNPACNGQPGNPVTFEDYGSGDLPVIDGSNKLTGWTLYSGDIYYSTEITSDPYVVWLDGQSYPEAADMNSVNSTNRWYWDSGTNRLYIHSVGNPASYYASTGVEAPVRSYALVFSNRNYLKFQNLRFRCGKLYSVYAGGTATYNEFKDCESYGIGFYCGFCLNENANYNTIDGCVIDGGNKAGGQNTLYILTDNNKIKNCIISRGSHSTLQLKHANNNIIEYNEIYSAPGFGRCVAIQSENGIGGNNTFRYNYVHDDYNDHPVSKGTNQFGAKGDQIYYNIFRGGNYYGIYLWSEDTTQDYLKDFKFYNNVIYGFASYGVRVNLKTDLCTGNVFKNNIIVGNGADTGNVQVSLKYAAEVNRVQFINNSIYHASTSNTVDNWGTARTVTYMESAYPSQWSNNLVSDPLFQGPPNDFHLQSGSPCIDKGTYVGLTQDYEGNSVPQGSAPEIGAYEYAGAPPSCAGTCRPNPCDTYIDCSPASGTCTSGYCCSGTCNGGASGLVTLYHFDENSDFTAGDSSGNGNDGTIYGANWTNGISGYALEFDGIGDYVDCGEDASLEITTNITVSAWILPNALENSDKFVSNFGYVGGGSSTGYELAMDSATNARFRVRDTSVVYDISSFAGNWTHLVGTNDGSYSRFYVNGVEVDSNPVGNPLAATYGLRIGMHGQSGGGWFNGTIDEVRIYNRALTQEEILELYSNPGGEQIPGDLNNDGFVDIADLGIIAANFGKTSGFEPRADVVDNNEIDVFDLVFVASRFT